MVGLVVAAPWCGDVVLQPGQESWSELMGRWMQLNTKQKVAVKDLRLRSKFIFKQDDNLLKQILFKNC